MTSDLREFLREAAGGSRGLDVEAVLERAGHLKRRRRLAVTGTAFAAVGVIAALLPLRMPDRAANVTAGPGATTVLSVPDRGRAAPEMLGVGLPVWVIHHQSGEVTVLSAVSAHKPFGLGHLVGWCPASQEFEDPVTGSQFDERGHKLSGPAPTGLDAFGTLDVSSNGQHVSVDASSAKPVPGSGAETDAAGSGNHCVGGASKLLVHTFRRDGAVTAAQAVEHRSQRMVLIRDAAVLLRRDTPSVVCTTPIRGGSCDGPEAFGVTLTGTQPPSVAKGLFLARFDANLVRDLVFVETPRITSLAHPNSSDSKPSVPAALCTQVARQGELRRADVIDPKAFEALIALLPDDRRVDAALFYYPYGDEIPAGTDRSGLAAEAAGRRLYALYKATCQYEGP